MEFRLLGAVAVDGDDGGLRLGPEKRRSLLTLLLRRNPGKWVDPYGDTLFDEQEAEAARREVAALVGD